MSADTIARLHIVLDDIEPAIWRRVDVPVTASRKMLHDIVQAAMGDGERRCPPEDVDGLPGFDMFLHAMADPTHEKHDHLREWYGGPYNALHPPRRRRHRYPPPRRQTRVPEKPRPIARRPTGHAYG